MKKAPPSFMYRPLLSTTPLSHEIRYAPGRLLKETRFLFFPGKAQLPTLASEACDYDA